jgi:SNF2 family DNA or RNA helicase
MVKCSSGDAAARTIVESRLKRDLSAIYQIPTLPSDTPVAVTPKLRVQLFPYQLRSLHRMLELEANPALGLISKKQITSRGGVIADVVGMGKTAQIIALFLTSRAQLGQPNLVVVPQHLAVQWVQEISKFTADLSVHMVRAPQ